MQGYKETRNWKQVKKFFFTTQGWSFFRENYAHGGPGLLSSSRYFHMGWLICGARMGQALRSTGIELSIMKKECQENKGLKRSWIWRKPPQRRAGSILAQDSSKRSVCGKQPVNWVCFAFPFFYFHFRHLFPLFISIYLGFLVLVFKYFKYFLRAIKVWVWGVVKKFIKRLIFFVQNPQLSEYELSTLCVWVILRWKLFQHGEFGIPNSTCCPFYYWKYRRF